MNKIEYANFINSSCDDGPGIRSVLFLQGCSRNCKGCHNQNIKEHGKGDFIDIDNLIEFIDENCCNKKITISGGEPLEQLESLKILVDKLKTKGYDICLYTGFEFEDIPKFLLTKLDYIKTGSFINDLKTANIQYVGSSNQNMYYIKNGIPVKLDLTI